MANEKDDVLDILNDNIEEQKNENTIIDADMKSAMEQGQLAYDVGEQHVDIQSNSSGGFKEFKPRQFKKAQTTTSDSYDSIVTDSGIDKNENLIGNSSTEYGAPDMDMSYSDDLDDAYNGLDSRSIFTKVLATTSYEDLKYKCGLQKGDSFTDYYNKTHYIPKGYEKEAKLALAEEKRMKLFSQYKSGDLSETDFLFKAYGKDLLLEAGHDFKNRMYWYNRAKNGDRSNPLDNPLFLNDVIDNARSLFFNEKFYTDFNNKDISSTLSGLVSGKRLSEEDFRDTFKYQVEQLMPSFDNDISKIMAYYQSGSMGNAFNPFIDIDDDGKVDYYYHTNGKMYAVEGSSGKGTQVCEVAYADDGQPAWVEIKEGPDGIIGSFLEGGAKFFTSFVDLFGIAGSAIGSIFDTSNQDFGYKFADHYSQYRAGINAIFSLDDVVTFNGEHRWDTEIAGAVGSIAAQIALATLTAGVGNAVGAAGTTVTRTGAQAAGTIAGKTVTGAITGAATGVLYAKGTNQDDDAMMKSILTGAGIGAAIGGIYGGATVGLKLDGKQAIRGMSKIFNYTQRINGGTIISTSSLLGNAFGNAAILGVKDFMQTVSQLYATNRVLDYYQRNEETYKTGLKKLSDGEIIGRGLATFGIDLLISGMFRATGSVGATTKFKALKNVKNNTFKSAGPIAQSMISNMGNHMVGCAVADSFFDIFENIVTMGVSAAASNGYAQDWGSLASTFANSTFSLQSVMQNAFILTKNLATYDVKVGGHSIMNNTSILMDREMEGLNAFTNSAESIFGAITKAAANQTDIQKANALNSLAQKLKTDFDNNLKTDGYIEATAKLIQDVDKVFDYETLNGNKEIAQFAQETLGIKDKKEYSEFLKTAFKLGKNGYPKGMFETALFKKADVATNEKIIDMMKNYIESASQIVFNNKENYKSLINSVLTGDFTESLGAELKGNRIIKGMIKKLAENNKALNQRIAINLSEALNNYVSKRNEFFTTDEAKEFSDKFASKINDYMDVVQTSPEDAVFKKNAQIIVEKDDKTGGYTVKQIVDKDGQNVDTSIKFQDILNDKEIVNFLIKNGQIKFEQKDGKMICNITKGFTLMYVKNDSINNFRSDPEAQLLETVLDEIVYLAATKDSKTGYTLLDTEAPLISSINVQNKTADANSRKKVYIITTDLKDNPTTEIAKLSSLRTLATTLIGLRSLYKSPRLTAQEKITLGNKLLYTLGYQTEDGVISQQDITNKLQTLLDDSLLDNEKGKAAKQTLELYKQKGISMLAMMGDYSTEKENEYRKQFVELCIQGVISKQDLADIVEHSNQIVKKSSVVNLFDPNRINISSLLFHNVDIPKEKLIKFATQTITSPLGLDLEDKDNGGYSHDEIDLFFSQEEKTQITKAMAEQNAKIEELTKKQNLSNSESETLAKLNKLKTDKTCELREKLICNITLELENKLKGMIQYQALREENDIIYTTVRGLNNIKTVQKYMDAYEDMKVISEIVAEYNVNVAQGDDYALSAKKATKLRSTLDKLNSTPEGKAILKYIKVDGTLTNTDMKLLDSIISNPTELVPFYGWQGVDGQNSLAITVGLKNALRLSQSDIDLGMKVFDKLIADYKTNNFVVKNEELDYFGIGIRNYIGMMYDNSKLDNITYTEIINDRLQDLNDIADKLIVDLNLSDTDKDELDDYFNKIFYKIKPEKTKTYSGIIKHFENLKLNIKDSTSYKIQLLDKIIDYYKPLDLERTNALQFNQSLEKLLNLSNAEYYEMISNPTEFINRLNNPSDTLHQKLLFKDKKNKFSSLLANALPNAINLIAQDYKNDTDENNFVKMVFLSGYFKNPKLLTESKAIDYIADFFNGNDSMLGKSTDYTLIKNDLNTLIDCALTEFEKDVDISHTKKFYIGADKNLYCTIDDKDINLSKLLYKYKDVVSTVLTTNSQSVNSAIRNDIENLQKFFYGNSKVYDSFTDLRPGSNVMIINVRECLPACHQEIHRMLNNSQQLTNKIAREKEQNKLEGLMNGTRQDTNWNFQFDEYFNNINGKGIIQGDIVKIDLDDAEQVASARFLLERLGYDTAAFYNAKQHIKRIPGVYFYNGDTPTVNLMTKINYDTLITSLKQIREVNVSNHSEKEIDYKWKMMNMFRSLTFADDNTVIDIGDKNNPTVFFATLFNDITNVDFSDYAQTSGYSKYLELLFKRGVAASQFGKLMPVESKGFTANGLVDNASIGNLFLNKILAALDAQKNNYLQRVLTITIDQSTITYDAIKKYNKNNNSLFIVPDSEINRIKSDPTNTVEFIINDDYFDENKRVDILNSLTKNGTLDLETFLPLINVNQKMSSGTFREVLDIPMTIESLGVRNFKQLFEDKYKNLSVLNQDYNEYKKFISKLKGNTTIANIISSYDGSNNYYIKSLYQHAYAAKKYSETISNLIPSEFEYIKSFCNNKIYETVGNELTNEIFKLAIDGNRTDEFNTKIEEIYNNIIKKLSISKANESATDRSISSSDGNLISTTTISNLNLNYNGSQFTIDDLKQLVLDISKMDIGNFVSDESSYDTSIIYNDHIGKLISLLDKDKDGNALLNLENMVELTLKEIYSVQIALNMLKDSWKDSKDIPANIKTALTKFINKLNTRVESLEKMDTIEKNVDIKSTTPEEKFTSIQRNILGENYPSIEVRNTILSRGKITDKELDILTDMYKARYDFKSPFKKYIKASSSYDPGNELSPLYRAMLNLFDLKVENLDKQASSYVTNFASKESIAEFFTKCSAFSKLLEGAYIVDSSGNIKNKSIFNGLSKEQLFEIAMLSNIYSSGTSMESIYTGSLLVEFNDDGSELKVNPLAYGSDSSNINKELYAELLQGEYGLAYVKEQQKKNPNKHFVLLQLDKNSFGNNIVGYKQDINIVDLNDETHLDNLYKNIFGEMVKDDYFMEQTKNDSIEDRVYKFYKRHLNSVSLNKQIIDIAKTLNIGERMAKKIVASIADYNSRNAVKMSDEALESFQSQLLGHELVDPKMTTEKTQTLNDVLFFGMTRDGLKENTRQALDIYAESLEEDITNNLQYGEQIVDIIDDILHGNKSFDDENVNKFFNNLSNEEKALSLKLYIAKRQHGSDLNYLLSNDPQQLRNNINQSLDKYKDKYINFKKNDDGTWSYKVEDLPLSHSGINSIDKLLSSNTSRTIIYDMEWLYGTTKDKNKVYQIGVTIFENGKIASEKTIYVYETLVNNKAEHRDHDNKTFTADDSNRLFYSEDANSFKDKINIATNGSNDPNVIVAKTFDEALAIFANEVGSKDVLVGFNNTAEDSDNSFILQSEFGKKFLESHDVLDVRKHLMNQRYTSTLNFNRKESLDYLRDKYPEIFKKYSTGNAHDAVSDNRDTLSLLEYLTSPDNTVSASKMYNKEINELTSILTKLGVNDNDIENAINDILDFKGFNRQLIDKEDYELANTKINELVRNESAIKKIKQAYELSLQNSRRKTAIQGVNKRIREQYENDNKDWVEFKKTTINNPFKRNELMKLQYALLLKLSKDNTGLFKLSSYKGVDQNVVEENIKALRSADNDLQERVNSVISKLYRIQYEKDNGFSENEFASNRNIVESFFTQEVETIVKSITDAGNNLKEAGLTKIESESILDIMSKITDKELSEFKEVYNSFLKDNIHIVGNQSSNNQIINETIITNPVLFNQYLRTVQSISGIFDSNDDSSFSDLCPNLAKRISNNMINSIGRFDQTYLTKLKRKKELMNKFAGERANIESKIIENFKKNFDEDFIQTRALMVMASEDSSKSIIDDSVSFHEANIGYDTLIRQWPELANNKDYKVGGHFYTTVWRQPGEGTTAHVLKINIMNGKGFTMSRATAKMDFNGDFDGDAYYIATPSAEQNSYGEKYFKYNSIITEVFNAITEQPKRTDKNTLNIKDAPSSLMDVFKKVYINNSYELVTNLDNLVKLITDPSKVDKTGKLLFDPTEFANNFNKQLKELAMKQLKVSVKQAELFAKEYGIKVYKSSNGNEFYVDTNINISKLGTTNNEALIRFFTNQKKMLNTNDAFISYIDSQMIGTYAKHLYGKTSEDEIRELLMNKENNSFYDAVRRQSFILPEDEHDRIKSLWIESIRRGQSKHTKQAKENKINKVLTTLDNVAKPLLDEEHFKALRNSLEEILSGNDEINFNTIGQLIEMAISESSFDNSFNHIMGIESANIISNSDKYKSKKENLEFIYKYLETINKDKYDFSNIDIDNMSVPELVFEAGKAYNYLLNEISDGSDIFVACSRNKDLAKIYLDYLTNTDNEAKSRIKLVEANNALDISGDSDTSKLISLGLNKMVVAVIDEPLFTDTMIPTQYNDLKIEQIVSNDKLFATREDLEELSNKVKINNKLTGREINTALKINATKRSNGASRFYDDETYYIHDVDVERGIVFTHETRSILDTDYVKLGETTSKKLKFTTDLTDYYSTGYIAGNVKIKSSFKNLLSEKINESKNGYILLKGNKLSSYIDNSSFKYLDRNNVEHSRIDKNYVYKLELDTNGNLKITIPNYNTVEGKYLGNINHLKPQFICSNSIIDLETKKGSHATSREIFDDDYTVTIQGKTYKAKLVEINDEALINSSIQSHLSVKNRTSDEISILQGNLAADALFFSGDVALKVSKGENDSTLHFYRIPEAYRFMKEQFDNADQPDGAEVNAMREFNTLRIASLIDILNDIDPNIVTDVLMDFGFKNPNNIEECLTQMYNRKDIGGIHGQDTIDSLLYKIRTIAKSNEKVEDIINNKINSSNIYKTIWSKEAEDTIRSSMKTYYDYSDDVDENGIIKIIGKRGKPANGKQANVKVSNTLEDFYANQIGSRIDHNNGNFIGKLQLTNMLLRNTDASIKNISKSSIINFQAYGLLDDDNLLVKGGQHNNGHAISIEESEEIPNYEFVRPDFKTGAYADAQNYVEDNETGTLVPMNVKFNDDTMMRSDPRTRNYINEVDGYRFETTLPPITKGRLNVFNTDGSNEQIYDAFTLGRSKFGNSTVDVPTLTLSENNGLRVDSSYSVLPETNFLEGYDNYKKEFNNVEYMKVYDEFEKMSRSRLETVLHSSDDKLQCAIESFENYDTDNVYSKALEYLSNSMKDNSDPYDPKANDYLNKVFSLITEEDEFNVADLTSKDNEIEISRKFFNSGGFGNKEHSSIDLEVETINLKNTKDKIKYDILGKEYKALIGFLNKNPNINNALNIFMKESYKIEIYDELIRNSKEHIRALGEYTYKEYVNEIKKSIAGDKDFDTVYQQAKVHIEEQMKSGPLSKVFLIANSLNQKLLYEAKKLSPFAVIGYMIPQDGSKKLYNKNNLDSLKSKQYYEAWKLNTNFSQKTIYDNNIAGADKFLNYFDDSMGYIGLIQYAAEEYARTKTMIYFNDSLKRKGYMNNQSTYLFAHDTLRKKFNTALEKAFTQIQNDKYVEFNKTTYEIMKNKISPLLKTYYVENDEYNSPNDMYELYTAINSELNLLLNDIPDFTDTSSSGILALRQREDYEQNMLKYETIIKLNDAHQNLMAVMVNMIDESNPDGASFLKEIYNSFTVPEGYCLVDSRGRKLVGGNTNNYSYKPFDLENIMDQLSMIHRLNKEEAIGKMMLTGDVYLMKESAAKQLEDKVFTVKQPSIITKFINKFKPFITSFIMATPLKLVDRIIDFSIYDTGVLSSMYSKTLVYEPAAVSTIRKYSNTDITDADIESDENLRYLIRFMEASGFNPYKGKNAIGEETKSVNIPLVKKWLDFSSNELTMQHAYIRFAAYLALVKEAEANDLQINKLHTGVAYHLMDGIDKATGYADTDTYKKFGDKAQAYADLDVKIAQIIAENDGMYGNMPYGATLLSRLGFMFTTFPLAALRWGKNRLESLAYAISDCATASNRDSIKYLMSNLGSTALTSGILFLLQLLLSPSLQKGMKKLLNKDEEELTDDEKKNVENILYKGGCVKIFESFITNEEQTSSSHSRSNISNLYSSYIADFIFKDSDDQSFFDSMLKVLKSNVVSRISPVIKDPIESIPGNKTFQSTPWYTPGDNWFENMARKISGYIVGSAQANAFIDGWSVAETEDEATFQRKFANGMKKAFIDSSSGINEYKSAYRNYKKAFNIINEYSNAIGKFKGIDYSRSSKYTELKTKLNSALKNGTKSSGIYNITQDALNNGTSWKDVISALNNCSLKYKISNISNINDFYNSISSNEQAVIASALAYENETYPFLDDIIEDIKNEYYHTENYVKSHQGKTHYLSNTLKNMTYNNNNTFSKRNNNYNKFRNAQYIFDRVYKKEPIDPSQEYNSMIDKMNRNDVPYSQKKNEQSDFYHNYLNIENN